MKLYRLLTFCVMTFLCAISCMAQKMAVAEFLWDQTDMTAKTAGTERADFNGNRCALIKVETTVQGMTFDVGSSGVVEVQAQGDSHPSEIWLYVPYGVKKISMQAPGYNAIIDYDLGESLKRGETYRLVLTADEVNSFVVNYDKTQQLNVSIDPADEATLFLNGTPYPQQSNGQYSIALPLGKYRWRVSAPSWHTKEGKIEIKDLEKPHTLDVRLMPAFGFLNIPSHVDNVDAEVYVDNLSVGRIPLVDCRVPSGKHKLCVKKRLFDTFESNINVSDNKHISMPVKLTPNCGGVALTVFKGDIFQ